MGFFWKFTRSGKYSKSYISLIVDVEPNFVDKENRIWHTSFEELEMFLVLLHDVEVINNPELGATKPAFKIVVESLGFEPTTKYCEKRNEYDLVKGQDKMGRHDGIPLDWGYYSNDKTKLELSIEGLEPAGFINAKDGKLFYKSKEDKLSCYRDYPYFEYLGFYWDLMPKHIHMNPIVRKMISVDIKRANEFLIKQLKWSLKEMIEKKPSNDFY